MPLSLPFAREPVFRVTIEPSLTSVVVVVLSGADIDGVSVDDTNVLAVDTDEKALIWRRLRTLDARCNEAGALLGVVGAMGVPKSAIASL